MGYNKWHDQPEEDKLRALLLALRYCANLTKSTKSDILKLLVTHNRDTYGQLLESITKMVVDQQIVDSLSLSNLMEKATNSIHRLRESSIRVLMIPDEEYPSRFKLLTDTPFVLMAKGNLNALNPEKSIAVIGTRNADDIIYNAGIEFSTHLAKLGWMIASGLAKGCDSAGHIGCIRGNGITTAILPSSIEKIYPSDNKGLAEEIVANNGCLVTEYLSTDRIQRFFFVQRDRLQAALSDNLLVLQTGIKGGTMHTVRYAHLYKKPVLAYLPNISLSPLMDMTGNLDLISSNKAIRVTDIESLIESLHDTGLNTDNTQNDIPAQSFSTDNVKSSTKNGQSDQMDIFGD